MALQNPIHLSHHHALGSRRQNLNHFRYMVEDVTISQGDNIYRFSQATLLPQQPYTTTDWHAFNPRQYQSSSSVGSATRFHMVDDVMLLDTSAIPNLDEIFPASWANVRTSIAQARDDISDGTMEANLNIEIYNSSMNLSSDSSSDPDICVVCQSEYENNEKIGTLKCGHLYHLDCIKKWLRKKNLCPICKATAISL